MQESFSIRQPLSERKDLLQRASKSTRFNLVDHDGKPITEFALKGQPTALFFGLTHCPDVCLTTLYEMSGWFDALGAEGADLNAFLFRWTRSVTLRNL